MEQLKNSLKNILQSNSNYLSEAELTYFKRSLNNHFRLPIFYGLPKVHKNQIALRPVVSTTNSLLAVFSTWLDYKMKELLPFVKSCIKNSTSVITNLKNLNIPPNAWLFSADAVSMYTYIDTTCGIQAIQAFLESNKDIIPNSFPNNLFLQVLEIIMNNNIFSFADTFWLQLSGTAIGTPAACAYATQHMGNTKIPSSYLPININSYIINVI